MGHKFEFYSQYPDLAKLPLGVHAAFKDIVLKGALSRNGMASFADVLSEAEVEAIQHFLLSEQRKLWAEENPTN